MANETGSGEFVDDYRRHTTPSGVEQLADAEFAVDVLGGYPDPLLRLGFDPKIARATNEGPFGSFGSYEGAMSPWYKAWWGDGPEVVKRNVERNLGRQSQADILRHEYRHRALNELRKDNLPSPFRTRPMWSIDDELRSVMGEQFPSDEGLSQDEKWRLNNALEENLTRSFDLRYGYPHVMGHAIDRYEEQPHFYPEKKETLTEFMNRVEGKARGLLSRRWDGQ